MGVAHRGAGRADEPRGADRRGPRVLLLHGAFARARGGGNPPEELQTSADVTFVPGTGITKIRLAVRGRVPGIDEAAFREAAEGARDDCPVSQALAAVGDISVEATFEG